MTITVEMLVGRKRIPRSVVRDTFYLMMETLQNRIKSIERVKALYYSGTLQEFISLGNAPSEYKKELHGLIRGETIYVSDSCDKNESIGVLIHEVAHLLFDIEDDGPKSERNALAMERILIRRFSKEQKEMLWALIPKSVTIERYPPLG